MQVFLDELGEEPKADFNASYDEFHKRLEVIGKFENKLQHGFQLRLASRIQTLIHTLGGKNIVDADLMLAMRRPPQDVATLTTIRDRLSVSVSGLKPKS
jgi:hypothetical protein